MDSIKNSLRIRQLLI